MSRQHSNAAAQHLLDRQPLPGAGDLLGEGRPLGSNRLPSGGYPLGGNGYRDRWRG